MSCPGGAAEVSSHYSLKKQILEWNILSLPHMPNCYYRAWLP
jgi:hypothetical protein